VTPRLEIAAHSLHDVSMRTTPFPSTPDCPIAPAARKSTHARALHRACVILGNVENLAEHLGVAQSDLLAWLEGTQEPPDEVFLAAVEVILLNLDAPARPV
jgi:hypothetical protein